MNRSLQVNLSTAFVCVSSRGESEIEFCGEWKFQIEKSQKFIALIYSISTYYYTLYFRFARWIRHLIIPGKAHQLKKLPKWLKYKIKCNACPRDIQSTVEVIMGSRCRNKSRREVVDLILFSIVSDCTLVSTNHLCIVQEARVWVIRCSSWGDFLKVISGFVAPMTVLYDGTIVMPCV